MRKELLLTLILTVSTAIMSPYATALTFGQAAGGAGVYDPAIAGIAAQKALFATQRILNDLHRPINLSIRNNMHRYMTIKAEQAHLAKIQLLLLWTDYFQSKHLAAYPDLHETIWYAAKLCDSVIVNVDLKQSEKLVETVKEIHDMYWDTKGRKVPFNQH